MSVHSQKGLRPTKVICEKNPGNSWGALPFHATVCKHHLIRCRLWRPETWAKNGYEHLIGSPHPQKKHAKHETCPVPPQKKMRGKAWAHDSWLTCAKHLHICFVELSYNLDCHNNPRLGFLFIADDMFVSNERQQFLNILHSTGRSCTWCVNMCQPTKTLKSCLSANECLQ